MMTGATMMVRRLGKMNRKLLLIALPAILTLSGCSNIKPIPVNHMTEDTLAHNEIFGSLDNNSFSRKLEPNKALNEGELYTPLISFQHKQNNDGTYSIRYIATIESKSMDIVWTRSVHDLNGSTSGGKAKGTKQVNTIYESLSDDGVQVWATNVEEKDDNEHVKPFNYYAVYCLLNIPNSVSSYYIDAYVTVTLGETSKNSYVGSVNIADKTKHMKYSLEEGDRYIAEVNCEFRESDALSDGNHLNLFSANLKANDKLRVYQLNTNSLTYSRLDSATLGKNNPDFSISSGELTVLHDGIYNVYLNSTNNFYFQKKIYFMGPSWWENDSAQPGIQLHEKNTNNYNDFIMESTGNDHQYSAFADITLEVKFFRKVGGNWYDQLGFYDFPTDGKDYYVQPLNSWYVFGEEIPVIDESNFQINELINPVEIHTEAQKTYLSYEGNYDQMPDNQYPDGTVHQSDSNAVTITWDYTVPNGKSVSKYSIVFGQKADLSDGYTVNGTTAKSISFYNPYLGRNYYKLVATFANNAGTEESAIHHFDVDSTCPRNLTIGGMTNCRDMGGRVTEDGGVVKQGLVYRTSGYMYDYNTEITADGITEMLNHLKVKTEVNVADNTNYNLNLSGTNVVNLLMDYDSNGTYSSNHLSRNAESLKQFFNLLADTTNYPVFFHCRIGTDRTGLCAIMLNGLLGVPMNEIYQDYLFSNFGNIQKKRYIGTKAGQDNIMKYIDEINNFPGETFKNKVYNVLLACGLPRTTLETVITNLTEGTLPQNNNANQVSATADQFTTSGGLTLHTTASNDRSHPDSYYVLNSSSQSVSYSFTANSDYVGQVVAYLGNTDHSSSKKIASAISCSLDSTPMTIRDVTYADAGMGKCSSRMNYFPVILGEVNVTAGSHTIKITGTSNTMNIGAISIFVSDGSGQSQGGGGDEPEHTTHVYSPETPETNKAGKQVTTYLCDCGKKYIDIAFTDYSSMSGGGIDSTGKIGGSNKISTTFKWDIPAKAGMVTLQFNIKMSSTSDDHKNHTFDSSLYSIKVNGVQQTILLQNGNTYSQLGLTTSGQYFDMATFEIPSDQNIEIEFVHNNAEYRLLFTESVRLMYAN